MPLPKNELDAFVAAWNRGDREAVSRTAAELGVVFDEATIEHRGGAGCEDLFRGIAWPGVESLALRLEVPKVNLLEMELPRLKELKIVGLAGTEKAKLRAAYPHATVS